MSTPQGPNGAEHPGRNPEDRNGHTVPSENDPARAESADAPTGTARGGEATKKPDEAPDRAAPAAKPAPTASSEKPAEAAGDSSGEATQAVKGAAQKPAGSAQGGTPAQPKVTKSEKKPAKTGPDGPEPAPKQEPGQVTRPVQQGRPAGGQTPPWQRGQQGGGQQGGGKPGKGGPTGAPQSPQNVPQTNVPGVGAGSQKGGAPKSPNRPGGPSQRPAAAVTAPKSGPATGSRPVVTGTAAPKPTGGQGADRSAAKAKAAVIDGPTRHIERKDLAKDLPDLSSVKHPTPAAAAAAPAASDTGHASPTVIPAAEGGDPLRATVQVRRIDPWSMLKVSSVISVSLFFVWMIAVGVLYGVLAGMGVWERLNSAFTDIVSDAGSDGLITAGQVFGYATVIGLANMVLMTALVTLGAFIYNLCTDLVGGVQVTLADPD